MVREGDDDAMSAAESSWEVLSDTSSNRLLGSYADAAATKPTKPPRACLGANAGKNPPRTARKPPLPRLDEENKENLDPALSCRSLADDERPVGEDALIYARRSRKTKQSAASRNLRLRRKAARGVLTPDHAHDETSTVDSCLAPQG